MKSMSMNAIKTLVRVKTEPHVRIYTGAIGVSVKKVSEVSFSGLIHSSSSDKR